MNEENSQEHKSLIHKIKYYILLENKVARDDAMAYELT